MLLHRLTISLIVILLASPLVLSNFTINESAAQADRISISPIKNLSDDKAMSRFAKIASSDSNVYVAWESEIFKQDDGAFTLKNLLLRKGIDYGENFGNIVNLVESSSSGGPSWINLDAASSNVYVTWVNASDVVYSNMTTVNTDLFLRTNSDCAETEFSEEVNISNSASTTILTLPQLQAQGSFVYMVWSESHENGTDLFLKRSEDNGQTFEDKINLTKETGSKEIQGIMYDTFAYLSNFYAVWTDYDTEGNKHLYLKRSIDFGETFEDAITIRTIPADVVGGIYDPKVIASNNKVYVVWRDNNTPDRKFAIFFKAITNYGRNIQDAITLSDLSRDSDSPRIAVYENNVYVTWEDHTDPKNPEIFFSASNDGGRNFSEAINLSNSDGESRQAEIVASHNNVYVVWREETDANADILLSFSTDNGSTFRTINLSNNSGYSSSPQIVAEPSVGRTYVVWEDATPGNFDIFFRMITDNLSPLVSAPTLGKGLIITEVELDPSEQDNIGQWIEVYNPTNSSISTTLGVSQPECNFPSFFLTSIELKSNEYMVIEIWGKDFGEPGFPKKDTSLAISSNKELDRTPKLTDIHTDTRTWQRVDGEWVFWNNTPWGGVPNKQLNLEIDKKEFIISIVGSSKADLIEFNKEMKSITLHVEQEEIENIRITLPKELLGDPYSLSMKQDGLEVKGIWEVKQNTTHASFSRDLPKGTTTIEITGTTVIPEFPMTLFILTTSFAGILAVRRIIKR